MKKFPAICSKRKSALDSCIHSRLASRFLASFLITTLLTGSVIAEQSAKSGAANRFATGPSNLPPGKPLERHLAGGEAHAYWIELRAGQYVRLRVEQKSIDVAFSVFRTDDTLIAEFDNQLGYPDVESACFIAETAGRYRLEVRPFETNAPAGSYLVAIEEQREATARDRRLVAANLDLHEARQRSSRTDPESIRRAIAKYNEAGAIFADEKQPLEQLQTLFGLASAHLELSEREKAIEYYEQALASSRRMGSRRHEAEALAGIAVIRNRLRRERTWMDLLYRVLEMYSESGDRRGQAAALNRLAAVHYSQGEYQKSLDLRHQALSVYRSLHYPRAEFNVLLALGTANNSMGERGRAIDYYQQALAVSQGFRNQAMEAEILLKIGQVYYGMVEYPTALRYYNQALPLSQSANDRYSECQILKSIGGAYLAMSRYREALEALTQSLHLARQEGKRELENGTLRNLAMAYAHLGEPEKSREYFNQELQFYRDTGSRQGLAMTLYVRAEFERDQGNYAAAIEDIRQAIDLMESFSASVVSRELRTSYFSRVRGLYELYIDILMLLHKRDPSKKYHEEALQLSEKARVRSLLEILTEAQANLRQGVDASLLAQERALQQLLNSRADDLMERQLNRATAAEITALNQEIADLTLQYQELQTRIRTSSPRYAALTQPATLTIRELQQQILDDDTVLLEYTLTRKRSYLWAVTKNSIDAYELSGRVGIRLVMQNFYDLLTARNKQIPFETRDEKRERVANADAALVKTSAELSRILLAPVASHLNRKRLLIVCDPTLEYIPFAVLPSPSAPEARVGEPEKGEGGQASVSSSDNHSSKPAPRLLIEDHEIVNLPSASMLAVLRQELKNRKPSPKTLAIFGDPVFSPNDDRVLSALSARSQNSVAPSSKNIATKNSASRKEAEQTSLSRLLFTRKEAETIASLVPANQKKAALDFEANRMAATSPELSLYRYVHFATHAFVNPSHPELSGIALSTVNKLGVEQDGFLRLYDIFNLRMPAELVVLSGCRTGLGKELRGEGLIGLTRGFMYAGAARVLVSLWDVSDQATADFMGRFYQAMLGKEKLSPAAALRAAQVSMAREARWSSPYFWAAFVLQGEPR